MASDIFCQIISGDIPATEVWRDEQAVAFLDHRPVFKGHVLICPTVHVATLLDLPDPLMQPLLAVARSIAAAMGPAFGAEGTFVAMNNVVSQSVPHLHIHVVPRSKGDGLRGFFWPRTKYADGEEAQYAERLREALRDAAGE
jgi:histidine triad (HIT) family protein